jgi:hypothetical protein
VVIEVLTYIAATRQFLNEDALRAAVRRALPEQEERIMSTLAEQWEQRGIEIGEKRGLKLGEERGLRLGEQRGEERGLKLGEERGLRLGEQRGLRLGEQRGLRLGEEQGLAKGKAAALLRILAHRFGEPSAPVRAAVLAADPDTLDLWIDRAFEAASPEAVVERPHHT